MRIGSRDPAARTVVIAEIGNNHEGSLGRAEHLVGLAAEAGADAVKFQTIDPSRLQAPTDADRLAQLERFRLPDDAWSRLARLATSLDVEFLSTPFHLGAVDLLQEHVAAWKIASGDNNFLPLMRRVASTGLPILVSTGLAGDAGVQRVVDTVTHAWPAGHPDLILLHCVVSYPTLAQDANLGAVRSLARFGFPVGYSDHTAGTAAAPIAVALGAVVIEKHFTDDHAHSDFRDHALSADPTEMAELVARVREVEGMLGDGEVGALPVEETARTAVRRSIAAARDLPEGHLLVEGDLTWLRPAVGLAPGEEDQLLGRRLRRAVRAGEPIRRDETT